MALIRTAQVFLRCDKCGEIFIAAVVGAQGSGTRERQCWCGATYTITVTVERKEG